MMPAVSLKQKHLMDAAAHNPAFAKKVGIPTKVAKEFSTASKGQKFSKGGDTMASKMNPGFMAMIAKKKGAAASPMGKPTMKKGMDMAKDGMKKMATGGFVRSADGVASKGKTKATQIKMNKGGMAC
jgi:hypothetical protein